MRSVAPAEDYSDEVSGQQVARVTTGQIYWGAAPFVCIQVIMVAIVIAFPGIVRKQVSPVLPDDLRSIEIDVPLSGPEAPPLIEVR